MKLKKLLACIMTLAILASVTACGGGNSASETSATTTTAATTTTTEETVDDDIENPVDVSNIDESLVDKTIEVAPVTLKYVGNYDMTKAGDIKPSVLFFKEQYGCDIEVQICAWDAIEETISLGIQSGTPADLIDKQDNSYPLWMSKNLYADLDGYIDMTAPQWQGLEQYVDRYQWDGHKYYYPWSYSVSPFFMIYNRGLFAEKGIDDPYQLYQEGKWDWNSMKKCMTDFVGNDTDILGMYGYFGSAFINSNGTSFVGIDESGRIVNNIKSTAVDQTQAFLEEIRKQGLGSANCGDYNNVDHNPIIEGLSAFHVIGGWKITEYSKAMKKDANLDIFFVPVPKSPYTDKYYYTMSTFGYCVPAGSPNVQQAALFINICRLSCTDPELQATKDASIMKNKKYTEEQYAFMKEFENPAGFDVIIDESLGFATDVNDIVKKMLGDVAFDQTEEQKSWTQMRDEYSSVLQDAIDVYNTYLN